MKTSSGEHDAPFGQAMCTLRAAIGLTQSELANRLEVSRRAVAAWEAGRSYPKEEHLKRFIALGLQRQAFPAGRETKEIHTLWKAAHQKVLFDEQWLSELLAQQDQWYSLLPSTAPSEVERTQASEQTIPRPATGSRVDWGEALAVPAFYGRESELAQLTTWVIHEHCRVVSVLGMGGIGKSALVVSLMGQMAPHFEIAVFRSLRDAPCWKHCSMIACRSSLHSHQVPSLSASNNASTS